MKLENGLRHPGVDVTFDLQNLIRSSTGASEYFLSVLSKAVHDI